jgi:hypothetical protein
VDTKLTLIVCHWVKCFVEQLHIKQFGSSHIKAKTKISKEKDSRDFCLYLTSANLSMSACNFVTVRTPWFLRPQGWQHCNCYIMITLLPNEVKKKKSNLRKQIVWLEKCSCVNFTVTMCHVLISTALYALLSMLCYGVQCLYDSRFIAYHFHSFWWFRL